MKKEKQSTPLYEKVVKLLKSRITRNAIVITILILSLLGMFMLDDKNEFRNDYLPFLNSNFVEGFMDLFNISRFNIEIGVWALFFVVFGLVLFMTIGNMVAHLVIKKSENKLLTGFIYYGVIFLVVAAITFVCYMLDVFDVVTHTSDVIVNLIYTILICLAFIVIIPLLVVLGYYLVKLIIYLLAHLFHSVGKLADDIAREENGYVVVKNDNTNQASSAPVGSAEALFPALVKIDQSEPVTVENPTDISLENLCLQFQSYASNVHQIYYGLPLIRSFVAGLATSRLIILEGLSGTGKSMLPRMFANFTNSNAFFASVQATWRDKSDVLGFYSEFAKTFKTTQFLENLYAASYSEKTNVMVLDEMNLSRIEYYFADFLSVMEYPSEDWKIRIFETQANQDLPNKLENGCISVPTNTYFVGTANTDDSTFTITDKVYDRSIVIDFDEKVKPIKTDFCSDAINVSAESLQKLFAEAQNDKNKRLTDKDIEKFLKLCDFMKEAFDVRFGNRIMVQIENFVPVYVALGGTKEEALDFMFARKILRKVSGMYEDFVKDELVNLTKLLTSLYGKGTFAETEKIIAKFTKKLV